MATVYEQDVQGIVGNQLSTFSAIEHEGQILIVVQWFANPKLGLRRPELVIPLVSVRYQATDDPKAPFRWFLNDPLPKSLFDGTASSQVLRQFGVCKGPDVTFPISPAHH